METSGASRGRQGQAGVGWVERGRVGRVALLQYFLSNLATGRAIGRTSRQVGRAMAGWEGYTLYTIH